MGRPPESAVRRGRGPAPPGLAAPLERRAGRAIVAYSLLAVFVTASRQAATNRARTTTGGALIEAQAVSTSLSDADRAVAGTFLTTDARPRPRSTSAIATTWPGPTTNLAEVSRTQAKRFGRRSQLDPAHAEIPVYCGLIETARTNDRRAIRSAPPTSARPTTC